MAYTGNSIVDYLRSVGQDPSYGARKKLAASKGITGYAGTADQNLKLLGILRSPVSDKKDVPVLEDKPIIKAEAKPEVKLDTASPIVDSNGNAYVITPGGFSTVGKGANGSYMLGSGDRYATQDEADKIKAALASGQPITPDMLQGISGKSSTGEMSFFDKAVDKLSPIRQKINDLLSSIFGDMSKPYNAAEDADYQMYRADMLKQADTAYSNINADYLGNQGGNFNSAAQQIASGAKNDLINRADLAAAEFEDRYNTNQRNKISDTMGIVNELLGIEEADTNAANKEFQRQIDTIGQYSNDYTAEINRRMAIDPNDPLIPYLKEAREEKKAGIATAQTAADKEAYDKAMAMWEKLGKATPEIAKILGIPVGAKTADYDIDSMNATTSRINANKSGGSASNSSDLGILLAGMLDSGNPQKWLDDNADWLGIDNYKALAPYAKGRGIDINKAFSSATRENRNYYDSLKDVYMGGASDTGKLYVNNPQAALNRLRSASTSKQLLGPLYAVLEAELQERVDALSNVKTGDPKVDSIAAEMLSSSDPLALLKTKTGLTATQIKQLTDIANSLKSGASPFRGQ